MITHGELRDLTGIIAALHEHDAIAIAAADILSLALLKPPGEMGADVVVGTTQRFGVPMGFGGPHAAYFATREAYQRSLPGRVVGVSVVRKRLGYTKGGLVQFTKRLGGPWRWNCSKNCSCCVPGYVASNAESRSPSLSGEHPPEPLGID